MDRSESLKVPLKRKRHKDTRRLKNKSTEMKKMAFDLSFTSQNFELLEIEESRKKSRVPKLKFDKIRQLKQCLLGYVVKEGSLSFDTLKHLVSDKAFTWCVFSLMDINGNHSLERWEMECIQSGVGPDGDFKKEFGKRIELATKKDEEVKADKFHSIWQKDGLDILFAEAVMSSENSEEVSITALTEFIIVFTNPK